MLGNFDQLIMMLRNSCLLFIICLLAACGELGAPDDNTRTLTLGNGGQITHPWDEAGPLPASNDWVNVEVAGYLLSENREGEGFSWTWTFTLGLKNPDVDMVAVSDVSDSNTVRLVAPDGGVFNNGKWLAQSEDMPVSGFHLPWLFRDGESVRVLRFSIADKNGETRILYQPVLFTHAGKQSLLSIARGQMEGAGSI